MTVSLDVVVRQDLLRWLRRECEVRPRRQHAVFEIIHSSSSTSLSIRLLLVLLPQTRGSTVIYATHIFDGLDDWPTHLHYITYKGTSGT